MLPYADRALVVPYELLPNDEIEPASASSEYAAGDGAVIGSSSSAAIETVDRSGEACDVEGSR